MAKLIKCSDCNKKVSVNASTCPNCGAPVVPPKEKPKPEKWVSFLIGAVILLLILAMCSSDPDETEATTASSAEVVNGEPTPESVVAETQAKKAQVEEQNKTLGMTPDEFGERFMAQSKKLGLGEHAWDKVDIKEGAVNDTFTIKISDALVLNGGVDKNGELRSLTYIMGKTDKGDEAAMNMILLGGITARVLNPDLPKEQTSQVVGDLMISAANKFAQTGEATESKIVGDVKYGVIASKALGLWLYFESVE
ncbi:zinc ribbon domain-containing protein [Psychrobacter urativorans]|uniref:zinc ribbon domain-containing protein n=1 Tax=Psychrobacter urativorans TaxID=45610 RepID=UPI00191B447E|nr:zinc ribbon domain-containing protein [Psychrobacter urativorans]